MSLTRGVTTSLTQPPAPGSPEGEESEGLCEGGTRVSNILFISGHTRGKAARWVANLVPLYENYGSAIASAAIRHENYGSAMIQRSL